MLELFSRIGLLQTKGLADDMLLAEGLLCLMSHPRDNLLFLLKMSMHLVSLMHGLMECLGFFRDGDSELRDDSGFLCSELVRMFFAFVHVHICTLVQGLFACLPLGRSHLTKS